MRPYRTLVFAEIVQESPLSVGGNLPHRLVDSPLALDGRNRPVLRGSTLAGCFIATARQLVAKLPAAITDTESAAPANQGQHTAKALVPSAWRFAHAHVLPRTTLDNKLTQEPTLFFQHVSIDQQTQAAKDDHLFSLEAVPPFTRWSFQLEISPSVHTDTDFATLEILAAEVLRCWERYSGAKLGRGSRHGYGWCHLENITIARLASHHAHLWPDAFAPERSAQGWLTYFQDAGVPLLDLNGFTKLYQQENRSFLTAQHAAIVLNGTLHVGERQDDFGRGYGVDTLSLGGHTRMELQAESLRDRVIPPPDLHFSPEDFQPDFVITTLPDANGKLVPSIPGASIRGVWRAALSRYLQATQGDMQQIDYLFGRTEQAGCLSISNATLMDDRWRLLWQQHVAIDELTGGSYESAKFDRLSVAQACFSWQAQLQVSNQAEAEQYSELLKRLLTCLGQGHLPIGGGIWRGHGHAEWRLTELATNYGSEQK